MVMDRTEFSSLEHYKRAPSKNLDTTFIHLSGNADEIIDCAMHVEHNKQILRIINEGHPDFFDEMKRYFGEKLGTSPTRECWAFNISKFDKVSVADALEGLDGRIKVLLIQGDYER